MMGNTALRVYFVSALIAVTYGIARWEKFALEPPEVQLPSWTFDQLPTQLGDWQGAAAELDPEIVKAVGAAPGRIVDRAYRDGLGHVISIHTAMFLKPIEGVYHTPLNCYRAGGWEKIAETRESLHPFDDLTIPVSLTTWRKEGNRVMVVYWYQLGKHVLFGRLDLGMKVRLSLAGRPKWPALIKVMLQIPVIESEDSKATILSFAEQVARWENQPERRKELLLIGDDEKSEDSEASP